MSSAVQGRRTGSTEMLIRKYRDKVFSENVLLPGILIIHMDPDVKHKMAINIKRPVSRYISTKIETASSKVNQSVQIKDKELLHNLFGKIT